MSYTVKILKKVEVSLIKKIDAIQYLIEARPLSDIIKLRTEFQEVIKNHGVLSKEAVEFCNKNAGKEADLFKLARKKTSHKHIERIVDLQSELSDVRNQIFMAELRQKC